MLHVLTHGGPDDQRWLVRRFGDRGVCRWIVGNRGRGLTGRQMARWVLGYGNDRATGWAHTSPAASASHWNSDIVGPSTSTFNLAEVVSAMRKKFAGVNRPWRYARERVAMRRVDKCFHERRAGGQGNADLGLEVDDKVE